ncbi:hypothetical protein [Sinorhizobium medicae]|uniref:hypothetical protein n=1 Tax=Sinorhizobium medicae TaxID=110321 RepID=UPI000C7DB12B|nr:hypothetical protein [Sinorhizobium medicae]PLU25721.1 hypothetical protein BMJ28_33455 [Sinorhizobium medicae]
MDRREFIAGAAMCAAAPFLPLRTPDLFPLPAGLTTEYLSGIAAHCREKLSQQRPRFVQGIDCTQMDIDQMTMQAEIFDRMASRTENFHALETELYARGREIEDKYNFRY